MTGDQLRALIPVAWRAVIDCAITETELEHLAARLDEDHREIFPPREQWFRALDETPLCDVRAVILGQDPYPTQGQAEGVAFSVPDGMLPVPPSLRRILSEAERVGDDRAGANVIASMGQARRLLAEHGAHSPGREGGWTRDDRVAAGDRRDLAGRRQSARPRGFHAVGSARAGGCPSRWHQGRPPAHPVPSVHPMERRGAFIGSNPFGCANDRLRALGLDPIDWSLD